MWKWTGDETDKIGAEDGRVSLLRRRYSFVIIFLVKRRT